MDNSYTNLLEAVQDRKLIVFGCGKYFGEFMLRYPLLTGYIEYILDNHPRTDTYTYGKSSIPIIRPSEIKKADLMNRVIIFCAGQWKEMKEQLDKMLEPKYIYFHYPLDVDYRKNRELGIYHRIIIPTVEKLREYSDVGNAARLLNADGEDGIIRGMESGGVRAIPRLTVALTPKCSLRCKECNNLMWGFSDCSDLQSEKIVASLKNIIEVMDIIPCIELIGGEPFAAKNLGSVLEYLLGQEKVMTVEITTNATIVPSGEIMDQIKHPKVYVHISNYGNIVKQDRFVRCMKENDIKVKMCDNQEKWIATGGIQKRNRDDGDLVRQYYCCIAGNLCKTLWEDKLYPCSRAASLSVLGIMPDCPYVDCSSVEDLAERLYSFYVVPSCGACDYCNAATENPVYVEPAIQLEK